MVTGQADGDVSAREFHACVRLRSVADEVSETPELGCVAGGDRLERGLEGVPVAVDVGDDRDLQRLLLGGLALAPAVLGQVLDALARAPL
jgi:hypothetical protein